MVQILVKVATCCCPALVSKLVQKKVCESSSPLESSLTLDLLSEIPKKIVRAMNGVPLAIKQARGMIKQSVQVRDFLGYFETPYQRGNGTKAPKKRLGL